MQAEHRCPSKTVDEHIVEIVSDSGEGAQTCGQIFADLLARNGNGIWTVEIIPAEIEPPKRSRAGASGYRIRIGSRPVTNAGDAADIVVAFNEQVLYSRIDAGALRPGTLVFADGSWLADADERIVKQYVEAIADFRARGYQVIPLPIAEECLKHADDVRKGKNFWILGLLCAIYDLDRTVVRQSIASRSAGVTGVTICTSASPSASSARFKSSLSSYGKSGTMNPATPAAAAARGSAASPKLSNGFR